jgi:4-amino-4-deoxy-L-arabinose transferase-like glycosyltransferase
MYMSATVSSANPANPLPPASEAGPVDGRFSSTLWVLAALAAWLLLTLGLRPLLLPDEGRYANVAWEMLQGSSLVPTLNGLPFFHKPPLFYWIDMAAMQLFGVGQFAARFGSLAGAWLMGASLFFFLQHTRSHRTAVIAVVVLASSPFYFVAAQYANHDMLVAGLITVAILALARAVDNPSETKLGWLVAAAITCALATLAKGLIGFVLPALVVGPWLLAQGRWRQLLRLLHPWALLAFSVVAAPWFIAMQLRYPGFFDYFFMEQHFRRFAQSSFNNVQPFWFFIAVLPLLMLPWALWIPVAIKRHWPERDARTGLYLWWVVAIVGFFSLPSSKLVGYVLPAIAPVCALLAIALAKPSARYWPWVAGASATLCLATVAALAWQAPNSNRGVALALASRIQPGDTVVMVEEYLYDVPFYAQLTTPVLITSDWADPELPRQDNWRKELFDAARFDLAKGRSVLKPIDQLDTLGCGEGAVWFAVSLRRVQQVKSLGIASRVYGDEHSELWHAAARACP